MFVLAGGQLRALGKHRQATTAPRAPTWGSPPGREAEGKGMHRQGDRTDSANQDGTPDRSPRGPQDRRAAGQQRGHLALPKG